MAFSFRRELIMIWNYNDNDEIHIILIRASVSLHTLAE